MRRKLLWVGDACCPSGFAEATHRTLDTLKDTWDVTVLGINYRGDPYDYPYDIYAAMPGGDGFGYGRFVWMLDRVQPDLVVLQNDSWNIPGYFKMIGYAKDQKLSRIPVVGTIAVDGTCIDGTTLNDLTAAFFWTEFGRREAQIGGCTVPTEVIPLGVSLADYYPTDRRAARKARSFPDQYLDAFLVGNVNRNQVRKRLDLSLRYFAEWWNTEGKPKNAFLYLHVAPTGDQGYDINRLARYYGISDQMVMAEPAMFYGLSVEKMRDTYNCFDVQISTTVGEGFGLTTFEGMACGVPQIVPKWSALEELCRNSAVLVPCTSTFISLPTVGAMGGVADETEFVKALSMLYHDARAREQIAGFGGIRVSEERFDWRNVGKKFEAALDAVMTRRAENIEAAQ